MRSRGARVAAHALQADGGHSQGCILAQVGGLLSNPALLLNYTSLTAPRPWSSCTAHEEEPHRDSRHMQRMQGVRVAAYALQADGGHSQGRIQAQVEGLV